MSGVTEINARQTVLSRNVLRTQLLLHRHRIVRSTFHRGIVGNDDAFSSNAKNHCGVNRCIVAVQLSPFDLSDAGDHTRSRNVVIAVQLIAGEL